MPHHLRARPVSSYYEEDSEVVRSGPYDSYASDYRVQELGTPGYGHHHNGGYADRVSEVVSYESNPGYGRHHHGGAAEVVERREEAVYESDPCRRAY